MATLEATGHARTGFTAPDPDYARRVRASYDKQAAMRLIGATLGELEPGFCSIVLAVRDDLTQQDGFVHAGIVSAIADSAGGYAGFTLFPIQSNVLTVEFKLNLVAPARGDRLIAEAVVVRPGRTLVITRADVFAEVAGQRTLCAIMQQTLIVVHDSSKTDAARSS